MTDTNSISFEPRNKSFDWNIVLCDSESNYCNLSNNGRAQEVPKICFNQNCRNDGNKWINIIGRFGGYSDLEVPYWICDKCSSELNLRHELLNHLVNKMQDHGEVHKTGVDFKNPEPISGKMTITTKDLDELIFNTQMELIEEDDQDNEKTTSIDIQSPKQRGCYNMYCSKEGTHRIDILNSTTLLADHEIPYFICDTCYTFFEYRRKAPLVFPSLGALFGMESERGKKVSGISPCTNQEVITTKDLHNLLESSRVRPTVEE
jgi:hypothetical protein